MMSGVWQKMVLVLSALAASVLTFRIPMVGFGALALVVLFLAVWRAPYRTALVLAFLTAAFPKAGIKLGDFPFPIFLFGLVLAVAILPSCARSVHRHTRATMVTLVVLGVWVVFRVVVFSSSAGLGGVFAYVAWAMIPVTLLYAATRVELPDLKWRSAIEGGFMVAAVFGLTQKVFGIEQTMIPGLTIAWGDSYEAKHNAIFGGTGADFSKIMSTYQSGNIFGVTAAVFLIVAVMRLSGRVGEAHDWALFLAAAGSVTLSGSRTALIASAVGIGVVLLRRGSLGRKAGALVGIGVVYVGVLQWAPGLAERYSFDQLIATGGAGRADIWRLALAQTGLSDWLFGADEYLPVEGGVGMILTHGLVGVLLLVGVVIGATRVRRDWRLPLLALGVAAVIDSSFALFPTWFLPAAAAACPLLARAPASRRPDGAGTDEGRPVDSSVGARAAHDRATRAPEDHQV